ncbi:MAG: LCP family protein [Chloroflexota bacterium]|nr:LCP family protein [Chloroflexota bacterium]
MTADGHRAPAIVLLAALLLAGCWASSPSPSPTIGPTSSPSPSPVPTASPAPTIKPTPIPIPLDEALLASRFTVLVLGEDSSLARRSGGITITNTDTMMVVSVSADRSSVVALSVPRDTVDIPLGDGSLYRGKINAIAYQLGLEAARGAMAALLGIEIDAYLKIDMDDFAWMVDAVGGVDVEVAARLYDPRIGVDLQPGPAHLDGAQALAYVRTRRDSDYARATRAQQVVVELARRWVSPDTGSARIGLLTRLGSLQTDIELRQLPTLVEIGRRSADASLTAIVLQPPRYAYFVGIEPGTARGWVMIPNVAEMRALARSLIGD